MDDVGANVDGPELLGYRQLFEPSTPLVARIGVNKQLSYVNAALCELLGRTESELVGRKQRDVIAREGPPIPRDERHVSEVWLVDGRGEKRRVQWITKPEHGEANEKPSLLAVGRDITTILSINVELHAGGGPIVDHVPDVLFSVSRDGRYRAHHAPQQRALFAPPSVFLGATLEAVLPHDLAVRVREALDTALTSGTPQRFDYTLEIANERRNLEAYAMRVDAEHALFVVRDRTTAPHIDDLRRAHGVLAAVPDVIVRATLVNAADGETPSVHLEPVAQRHIEALRALDLSRTVRTALAELVRRAVRSGKPQVLHEFEAQREGGRDTFEARVVKNGSDEAVCFIRNIGEHRRLIAHMVQVDRIRAISTLVAGVGHQINNPLSYVVGNLDFLHAEIDEAREALEDSVGVGGESGANDSMGVAMAVQQALSSFEAVGEALADIEEGVGRITGIVRDLRVFSHSDEELAPLDVCEVIDEAIAIVDNEIRHRARLTRRYDDAPHVFGDRARLQQLFFNLLLNATQSIDEGSAASNDISVEVSCDDEWVAIRICDSGCGIPVELIGQVFDPFFTTKPVGQGSGLGLAVSREIVRLHGGELTLESERDVGTDVRVRLCAATAGETVLAAVDERTPTRKHGDTLKLLLIDDEPGVGRAVPRLLGKDAQVTYCATARAALEAIASDADYDLVLCDLMMPEMTGAEFYEVLLVKYPELAERVVFVTGGAFTPVAQAFLDRVDVRVLYKPFDGSDLRELLDDLS